VGPSCPNPITAARDFPVNKALEIRKKYLMENRAYGMK
jgi:hypothetical protein